MAAVTIGYGTPLHGPGRPKKAVEGAVEFLPQDRYAIGDITVSIEITVPL